MTDTLVLNIADAVAAVAYCLLLGAMFLLYRATRARFIPWLMVPAILLLAFAGVVLPRLILHR